MASDPPEDIIPTLIVLRQKGVRPLWRKLLHNLNLAHPALPLTLRQKWGLTFLEALSDALRLVHHAG